MLRRPNTQTVQWFLEMHASGQLDLNPAYQRRSVWNLSYRRYFIDTILRDYPSPTIYLQVETKPGVPTIHHVIDGKQRLETLLKFTLDEFHLANYLDDFGYSSPYFSDLEEDLQEKLVEYVLSVENISKTTPEEIKSAFERLNRNTAKLNNQELRKAQYEGEFISKMSLLAEDPYWSSIGVASRARVSRMLDVEYVSEIYLLTKLGVLDGTPAVLDQYYSEYDDEIPDDESVEKRYKETLAYFSNLDLTNTRWTNLGDFYSLWAAVLELTDAGLLPDQELVESRLREFNARIAEPKTEDERRYSDAVRQGTNKQTSRRIRTDILKKIIEARQ